MIAIWSAVITVGGTLFITVINVYFLNRKIGKQNEEVNKRIEDYRLIADKQRQVSSLYYNKRAERLLSLYENLSIYYSTLIFMGLKLESLQTEFYSREDVIDSQYVLLHNLGDVLRKDVLLSRIYLSDEDYLHVIDFYQIMAEDFSYIVDVYEEFVNISKKYPKRNDSTEQSLHFVMEYTSVVQASEMIEKISYLNTEGEKDIDKIKNLLQDLLIKE